MLNMGNNTRSHLAFPSRSSFSYMSPGPLYSCLAYLPAYKKSHVDARGTRPSIAFCFCFTSERKERQTLKIQACYIKMLNLYRTILCQINHFYRWTCSFNRLGCMNLIMAEFGSGTSWLDYRWNLNLQSRMRSLNLVGGGGWHGSKWLAAVTVGFFVAEDHVIWMEICR